VPTKSKMDKKISIKNKVVLVTGSNRGIGKAITEEMIKNGAKKVYATARNIESLDDLKKKYGDKLVQVKLDVTSKEDIKNLSKIANDVEILVNNSGVFSQGSIGSENLLEGLKQNLDVNLYGVVNVTEALLSTIKSKESGAIVIVSSIAALGNMSYGQAYSISKAATHSLIQAYRGHFKDTNILVSGLYPGPIETDMTKDFDIVKETPEQVGKATVQGIENGDEEIFTDSVSEHYGELYMRAPKLVEKDYQNNF
jgi:NADP-dependent 3-hydroxy acid dehydrogenase YdfG